MPKILDLLNESSFEWPNKTVFNINLPVTPPEQVKGIALANLGSRMYKDTYEERVDPRGRFYYWLSGDLIKSDPDPESDVSRLAEGYISITPITFEMTNKELMAKVKNGFADLEKKLKIK